MHANARAAMTATAAATTRHSQPASTHNASAVQTDLAYARPEKRTIVRALALHRVHLSPDW
jgi:hypothetical protein